MTGYADAGSEPGAPERGDVFSHLSIMRNTQGSVKKKHPEFDVCLRNKGDCTVGSASWFSA